MDKIGTLYQVGSASEVYGYERDDYGDGAGNLLTIEVFDLHVRPKPAVMPCTDRAIRGGYEPSSPQAG